MFFRESIAEWLLSVFQDWETFLISHGHKQISLCPSSATLSPTFLNIFGPGNLGFSQVVSWDPPKEENWKRVIRELYIFYFNVLVLIFLQRLGLFTNNQQLGSGCHSKGLCQISSSTWEVPMNSIFILICPSLYITEITTGDGEYRPEGCLGSKWSLVFLRRGKHWQIFSSWVNWRWAQG